jgi:hypothetical protein
MQRKPRAGANKTINEMKNENKFINQIRAPGIISI